MQIAIETRFDSLLQMTNDVLNTECCVLLCVISMTTQTRYI